MERRKGRKKAHMDDRGSGLVMVLIMVAFLGILAGILMFGSYMGYKMRMTDKAGKDNFYTVETVLDEINVGLQQEISAALTVAYQDVMVNYSLYETPEKRNQRLYEVYYDALKTALRLDIAHPETYNIEMLRGYLSGDICGDGKEGTPADGSREHFGTYGAIVESNVNPASYTMQLLADGIILKDLKLTYVNTSGYVAIITTDIRIGLPNVNFAQNSAMPNLEKYCLIAEDALLLGNPFSGGSLTVEGDAYAGRIQAGKLSDATAEGVTVRFVQSGEEEDAALVVSKGDILVEKGVLTTENTELWCGNIVLNSADLSLSGSTFVKNDLKVNGNGSSVTLAGSYTGFGVSLSDAAESSAILVNGRNSSLDLSGLTGVSIGGHAYVSASDDYGTKQILMGESVAVKSNQLIYLVPSQALGCEILEDGSVGDSVYNSNPLTLEQYQELVSNSGSYVMIDGNKQIAELGYGKLKDYIDQEPVAGGGSAYVPEVVFQQTSSGKTLVYCYLRFKDEAAANRYFRDYYQVNEDKVDKYTRLYAQEIKMADTADTVFLHLAGNVLAYEEDGNAEVIVATDSYRDKKEAEFSSVSRSSIFQALTSKLVSNIAQLTTTEQGRTVFENVVDRAALEYMVDKLAEPADNYVKIDTEGAVTQSVILCTGNFTVDAAVPDEVHMIVCLGDVQVERDFYGLIISGGTVLVCDRTGTSQKLTPLTLAEFTELMLTTKEKDGEEYCVLDVFRDGVRYTQAGNMSWDTGTEEVVLADLIVYERWSKE